MVKLRGIPYWGSSSFKDTREIKNLNNKNITLEEINHLCRCRGINISIRDVYSLFLALAELDFLFVIESDKIYLSWCRDICFNYRDRELFIPYYYYDSMDITLDKKLNDIDYCDIRDGYILNLKYNYNLNKYILHSNKDSIDLKNVVVYDKENKVVYTIKLKGVKFLSDNYFSIVDLHNKYVNAAYVNNYFVDDFDITRYNIIKWKHKMNKDFYYRKKLGLSAYGDSFLDIDYCDVRMYTFSDLHNGLMLDLDEEYYWRRRIDFEAYLYCIFAEGLNILEDEYKVAYKNLGTTVRFIKYVGDNGLPLVLKYYYKKDFKMRRKTYERFK